MLINLFVNNFAHPVEKTCTRPTFMNHQQQPQHAIIIIILFRLLIEFKTTTVSTLKSHWLSVFFRACTRRQYTTNTAQRGKFPQEDSHTDKTTQLFQQILLYKPLLFTFTDWNKVSALTWTPNCLQHISNDRWVPCSFKIKCILTTNLANKWNDIQSLSSV